MNGTDVVMEGKSMEDHQSAGFRLRYAREQWGLSIREVAGALNLLPSLVRAIEANRCDALAMDNQFVRQLHDYANLMLLDGNDVERTYHAQSIVLLEHIQERPVENTKRHYGTWVGAGGVLIISACVWFGWFHQTLPIDTGNTKAIRSDTNGNKPPIAPRRVRNGSAAIRTNERYTNDKLPITAGEMRARTDQMPLALVPKPLRSNAWFATLEPDRYTLQLVSFTREESSRAFIQRRGLQEDAAYFAVDNDDGETWYAVTYGLFNSYEMAVSAIRNLPDRISHLKPRVRNTGRIQHIMRP